MAEETEESVHEEGRKLFVGGLAFETTSDTFKNFFSKWGDVTDAVIMPDRFTGRSRGFGFITFSDAESAKRVLKEREITLDGRILKPTIALPRDRHGGPHATTRGGSDRKREGDEPTPRDGPPPEPLDGTGSPTDVEKLYIGGVPYSTSDEGFREFFEKFGELADCILMRDRSSGRSRGFGFITFIDRPSMERALASTGELLDGRNLDIKLAVPQGEMGIIEREKQRARMTGIEPPKKVFVKGLAEETTEEEMRQFFRRFGLIAEVMIIKDRQTQRSRGFGFVTFEHFDAAIHVVNSSKPIRMRDRVIACTVALPKEGGARGGHGFDRGGYLIPTPHGYVDPYSRHGGGGGYPGGGGHPGAAGGYDDPYYRGHPRGVGSGHHYPQHGGPRGYRGHASASRSPPRGGGGYDAPPPVAPMAADPYYGGRSRYRDDYGMPSVDPRVVDPYYGANMGPTGAPPGADPYHGGDARRYQAY